MAFVPGLNEVSYKILRALFDPYSDSNYLHYEHLEQRTGLTRGELKPVIDTFRKIGIIDYARGLMTEDGEPYGSGFGIPHDKELVVEVALFRYLHGRLDDFEVPPRPRELIVNGAKYVIANSNEATPSVDRAIEEAYGK